MTDLVRLDEQFAIVADTDAARQPRRVLKHGDTFGVFDLNGDITAQEAGEHGLYHAGTRFLSRFELLLGRRRPLLLNSTISADNTILAADLTNLDVVQGDTVLVPKGSLHLFRSRTLWDGYCVERVRVSNHALHAIEVPITVLFDADFRDVFEVRGTRRVRRGSLRAPDASSPDCVVLAYDGLDHIQRRTVIRWQPVARHSDGSSAAFVSTLEPHDTIELEFTIACEAGAERRRGVAHGDIIALAKASSREREAQQCGIVTSNASVNRWFRRSAADLGMMLTDTPDGLYPYAGIPWFSTPFGRDGIITALETLWAAPEIARGVLTFLARTQATEVSDAQDAQPGKILHEMRGGEMAALGEIPFGRYYGSADSTPLFVMLAHAYCERTGDVGLIADLWPHVLAALEWMDRFGDLDGDGFIEYARRSRQGLVQQGWKDSYDSIFHADGTLAGPPIALCEIQGYAYAAWTGAAGLAAARGEWRLETEWRERAARLRARFEEAFWCPDLGTYALALDGDKQACRVRTSNPGHCLFTGIVAPARARQVADVLMAERMFAGWGIRTVASGEARYNPMSYHNGSIWPHDNAIVAAGLGRYGFTGAASRITSAMLDLSEAVDDHRLPELICGFHRREGEHPTLYPVACAPQAWASGAAYLLLGACLNLRIDAAARSVWFSHALLPEAIDWLRLTNLSVGDATIDLLLTRHQHDVSIRVLDRRGEVEIVATK